MAAPPVDPGALQLKAVPAPLAAVLADTEVGMPGAVVGLGDCVGLVLGLAVGVGLALGLAVGVALGVAVATGVGLVVHARSPSKVPSGYWARVVVPPVKLLVQLLCAPESEDAPATQVGPAVIG